ncbi:MAG: lamin tail domain-containing protein [Phycisphaerales bacterium]|nr:MAG: lamin tail domain-containing protein [Phycisphaerales bacterium]
MLGSTRIHVYFLLACAFLGGLAAGECPKGDINGDCDVDFGDIALLASDWLTSGEGPADLTGNQQVEMRDFTRLAEDWHKPTVVINELHVDPDVKTERIEYVELHNPGKRNVDISGWYFSDGISFTFPQGTTLWAGGYVIVTKDPNDIDDKWNGGKKPLVPMYFVHGPFEGGLDNDGERVRLRNADGDEVDEVDYQLGFPWPTVGDPVPPSAVGSGHSMQLINPLIDNDLGASWRSAYPTPAAFNAGVYTENPPPHIRQVRHRPEQPKSDEPVTITAKVTDDDGVASVMLQYQIVEPGSYISRLDGQYYSNWMGATMLDNGFGGDETAGDDTYTVQLPPSVQKHRRLIRYRIMIMDTLSNFLMAPYMDDQQPNFAYFVYDGVPPWYGAIRPGSTPVVEYPESVMQSLPVYHLISKKSDIETATWFEKYTGSEYKWYGTLVYDGEVYDHIHYRTRGGVWRYAMGKNMWKFDFNRGHSFQARDDYGNKYDTKWTKLNFSACIQQGSFGQRGEQGMFEALTFKMFNLAGVPAPKTNWLHFRIIDERYEDGMLNAAHSPHTSGGTQYDGDFWGLHMTIEQMDGRFLNEHLLPDGNLFKMDNANHETNNQGPTQPSDQSDLDWFLGRYAAMNEQWWLENVNLESWYGYYAVYHAAHHGDITGKNWFLYHHPETDVWWQLPWDVDLTWTTYYGSMSDPFSRAGILNYSNIGVAAKNRVREFCDLLFNTEQMGRLIDDFAAIIDDPDGGLSMVDADRAMWDYHWVMSDAACSQYRNRCGSNKAGQWRFYNKAEQEGYDRSFEGMVSVMKDYVGARLGHMNSLSSDSAIPRTPTIAATCPPTFPTNSLTFATSLFSDPQGSGTFGGMQWRIAEVAAGSEVPEPPTQGTVLVDERSLWKYFKGTQEPSTEQGAWREIGFGDSGWLQGYTPIGYGEGFVLTPLNDMRNNYSTVYLRKQFEVTDLEDIDELALEVKYDDGFNVWINGFPVKNDNVSGYELPYTAVAEQGLERPDFERFVLPDPSRYLNSGLNLIAVQLLNMSLGNSSDCFLDIRLTGESSDEPPVVPPNYLKSEGKYEIEPVWQSGEIADFNDTIQIPATAVRVGRTYRVRCRMKDNSGRWSHWSSPVQFVSGEPVSTGIRDDLRITELMYHPAEGGGYDKDYYEFIELKNIGDEVLDLNDLAFVDGIEFVFYGSKVTRLEPGQFVLVVKDEAAFESRYGTGLSDRIAGQFTAGNLKNGGERVTLEDLWNGRIADFEYRDARGWPLSADGGGHSLVPLDSALLNEPGGSLNYGGNWRASAYIGGSPGADDPEPPSSLLINELMAHTDYSNPSNPEYDSNDWVELYNPTGGSINLNSWYLSDDIDDLKKWAAPAIDLAAGGRIVFDEVSGFHNPITAGFGLNKAGEQLFLSYLPGTGEDRVVDFIGFKGQENAISLGRYPDGGEWWFGMNPSCEKANTAPVVAGIVIDELMYHPVDPNEEYIELYNATAGLIYLESYEGPWELDGAVDYEFAAGTSIAAGGRLIVVGFDPDAEPTRLVAFQNAYKTGSLAVGAEIVGPWSGSLSNAGERVTLEKPQAPDLVGDPVSWVIIDEVIYSDVEPWPVAADGTGDALQRLSAASHIAGSDPANWQAAPPSPGK